jgi:glucan biosynthesis protein C
VRSVVIVVTPDAGDSQVTASGSRPHGRYDDLDALRGLLMLLGVILHAALIYSTRAAWAISDPQQHPAFDAVYHVIHTFRMPTFFMISGLLCAAGLRKGAGRFLAGRTPRLLVPLAATALLVNSVQVALVSGPATFWADYTGGRWVGHLWFLLDLLVYVHLATAVRAFAPRVLDWQPPTAGGAVLLALPLATAAVRWAGDRFLGPGASFVGFLNLADLLYYLPFFAFGLLYQPGRNTAQLRRLAAWAVPLLAVAVILRPNGGAEGGYIDAAVSWAASLACLAAGRALLNRPSALARALADASYTVYLLHQVVVVALGLALVPADLPAGAKFAVVATGGFLIPWAAHVFLVRRYRWLRFLFNGRWPSKSDHPPAAPAARDGSTGPLSNGDGYCRKMLPLPLIRHVGPHSGPFAHAGGGSTAARPSAISAHGLVQYASEIGPQSG